MAGLVGLEGDKWAIRGFAAGAVLLLGVINVAGVKWVIKLQFLLLLVLLCAGLNFMVGSFIGEDPGKIGLYRNDLENTKNYAFITLTIVVTIYSKWFHRMEC